MDQSGMEAPKGYTGEFKAMGILHNAMLVGQILFAGIMAMQVYGMQYEPAISDSTWLQAGIIGLAAAAFVLSQLIFSKRLARARELSTTREKLVAYRAAFILRNAILEGPALMGIIIFFLAGNILYLGVVLALIVWFALQYPTRSKVLAHLGLDELSLYGDGNDSF